MTRVLFHPHDRRSGQLCLGFGHVLTAHGYHAAMWC